MADFDDGQGQQSGKLKPMLFFMVLFFISFFIIFSILYVITRGLQSPITFMDPAADSLNMASDSLAAEGDSLAILEDSLAVAEPDTVSEDSMFMAIEMDSVRKLLGLFNREKKKQANQLLQIKKELASLKEEKKKSDRINDTHIKQLAKVYEAMKPEKAAEILKELDNELLTAIFRQIKQRQAAKIMAALPPNRAAKLSRMLGKK
jgi:hypothetical protein